MLRLPEQVGSSNLLNIPRVATFYSDRRLILNVALSGCISALLKSGGERKTGKGLALRVGLEPATFAAILLVVRIFLVVVVRKKKTNLFHDQMELKELA